MSGKLKLESSRLFSEIKNEVKKVSCLQTLITISFIAQYFSLLL